MQQGVVMTEELAQQRAMENEKAGIDSEIEIDSELLKIMGGLPDQIAFISSEVRNHLAAYHGETGKLPGCLKLSIKDFGPAS